jgi:hypothetical protein
LSRKFGPSSIGVNDSITIVAVKGGKRIFRRGDLKYLDSKGERFRILMP